MTLQGPVKMLSPGRVFRRDNDDATHSAVLSNRRSCRH